MNLINSPRFDVSRCYQRYLSSALNFDNLTKFFLKVRNLINVDLLHV